MSDPPQTNTSLLQILKRIPWRLLYIPGLSLLLLGLFSLAYALNFERTYPQPGWTMAFANVFLVILGVFAFLVGVLLCVAWYTFKNVEFKRADGTTQANTNDGTSTTSREPRLNSSVSVETFRNVPWRYLHIPGLSLILGSFLSFAYGMCLPRSHADSTHWNTSPYFFLMLANPLFMAGCFLCMGWYVCKDVDIEYQEWKRQQRAASSGVSGHGSKTAGGHSSGNNGNH